MKMYSFLYILKWDLLFRGLWHQKIEDHLRLLLLLKLYKDFEKHSFVINNNIDLLVLAAHRDQSVYISTHHRSSWHQSRTNRLSWVRHLERLRRNTTCCLWPTAFHMTRGGSWPHALTSTGSCWKPASSASMYPTGEHSRVGL